MADKTPEAVRDRILAELAVGESLDSICRQKGYPTARAVYRWIAADPAFAQRYFEARAAGYECHADGILAISDNIGTPVIVDGKVILKPDGTPLLAVTPEAVNHARLRIDARKWLLAKMLPKRYGEQITLAGDKDRPIAVTISNEDAGIL